MAYVEMPAITAKCSKQQQVKDYYDEVAQHWIYKTVTVTTNVPVTFKINYTESYNASTNQTTVTLSSVQAKTTMNVGSMNFNNGGIYFSTNNSSWTTITALSNSTCSLNTSYNNVGNISSGSLGGFTHNSSGNATLYIKCSFAINSQIVGYSSVVSGTGSGSLTTRLSTLTIYPAGGLWNGSTSNRSFSQVPTSTKSIGVASCTGYNFTGWTKGGGGSFNSTSNVFTFGDSNGTLTANWEPIPYTLTTQVSPDDAGTVTAGDTLYYQGTKELVTAPNNVVGYTITFAGWSLTSGSVNPTNSLTTTFTMGAGDAIVTANFNKVANTYTVVFNGNSATGGEMSSQTFTYDEVQSLNSNQFEKTNYTFIGWNTKADNTGTSYSDGQSVANLTAEQDGIINLYAVWQSNNANIGYNANGHGAAPIGQVKEPDVDITLASFIDTTESYTEQFSITADLNGGFWSSNNHSNGDATRTINRTWLQVEWNTSQDGTGTSYGSSATYSSNDSVTLYAIWPSSEPIPEFNYTYNVPTGTPSQLQTATIVYDAGESGTITTSSAFTSRIRNFDGWYTDPSGGIKRTSDSQVSDNEIVYAHYLDTPAFPSVLLPDSTECIKPHYLLSGWDTSSGASTIVYQPGASFIPTGDTTLYAVWHKKGGKAIMYIGGEKYQIFICNGSSWDQYQAYIAQDSNWVAY